MRRHARVGLHPMHHLGQPPTWESRQSVSRSTQPVPTSGPEGRVPHPGAASFRRRRRWLLALGGVVLAAFWLERSGPRRLVHGTASPPLATKDRPQDAIRRPKVYFQELSFDGCQSHWSSRRPLPERIQALVRIGRLTGRCYVSRARPR